MSGPSARYDRRRDFENLLNGLNGAVDTRSSRTLETVKLLPASIAYASVISVQIADSHTNPSGLFRVLSPQVDFVEDERAP